MTYVANAGLHYLQARLLLQRLLLLDCKTQAEEAASVSSGDKLAHFSFPEAQRVAADTENDGKSCRSESDVKLVMEDDRSAHVQARTCAENIHQLLRLRC